MRTQRDGGEVWGQLKVGGEEGRWKNGNESQHVTGKIRVPQTSRPFSTFGMWNEAQFLFSKKASKTGRDTERSNRRAEIEI